MATKKRPTRKRAKKVVPTKAPASLQEMHDSTVNAEVLGKGHTVAGLTLRPVTLETIVLLKQVNSPLILGEEISQVENIFLDCCIFIVLQTVDSMEARKLAWDEEALRNKALDLSATIPAGEFETLTQGINSILGDATTTAVDAKPPKGEKPGDPLGN